MRWIPATPPTATVDALVRELGIPRLQAHLLAARGITEPGEARAFLAPSLRAFPDPFTMPDMDRAAARLARAVQEGERILVWGDYDVDGITATVLLLSFLEDCGAGADFYLPHREDDGYGMNLPRALKAVEDGVRLVVTVDCGTANHSEVEHLASAGVDVIVTDHHALQGAAPPALAFLNPQRDDAPAAFRPLAGVGVAFLLVAAARRVLDPGGGRTPPLTSYLDVVALGTIADMVPLQGVNRSLVFHGLRGWERPARPGLAALKRVAGVEDRGLDSGAIAFTIGPRLNAAGRLDTARRSVDLLRTPSFGEGLAMARELDRLNTERKTLEAAIFAQALDQVAARHGTATPGVVVVAGEGWPRGVLGIVASRLAARYHRPALALGLDQEGSASGSGRSIRGFHLVRALEGTRDLLDRFGGHAMAAGLTLPAARLDALRERLQAALAATLSPEDLEPCLAVDVELTLDTLDASSVQAVEALAPFGAGNPEPLFLSRGVPVLARQNVGRDPVHLKLVLDGGGGRRLEAIAFHRAGEVLSAGDRVDLVYVPEVRTFRGVRSLRLRVEDLRGSAP
ncbi:MAG: single-stranded-DNA-specific exonuclease RecJ [Deltaproteobacteria bacterium]|nr:single-stranded-DNA-specific exonuclease RecJ [Deltaproteobacteria bacterium]